MHFEKAHRRNSINWHHHEYQNKAAGGMWNMNKMRYDYSRPNKMIPPINLLFNFLQQQTPVQIWLYEQVDSRLEGKIRVCIMSSNYGES
jgi:hypothetical protein